MRRGIATLRGLTTSMVRRAKVGLRRELLGALHVSHTCHAGCITHLLTVCFAACLCMGWHDMMVKMKRTPTTRDSSMIGISGVQVTRIMQRGRTPMMKMRKDRRATVIPCSMPTMPHAPKKSTSHMQGVLSLASDLFYPRSGRLR